MSKELKRTMVAQAAVDFSEQFATNFARVPVGGACFRTAWLAVPEGMSTKGGKHAMQHIVLKPVKEGFSTITVGWLDLTKHMAQLRAYPYLLAIHRQRYGNRPFDLEQNSYVAFLEQAQKFFSYQGISCSVEVPPPDLIKSVGASGGGSSSRDIILIVVGVGAVLLALVGAGFAYAFLLH